MRLWRRRRKSLKGYEVKNLLFFLVFMIALGTFVAFVFRAYRYPDEARRGYEENPNGILSEAVDPASGFCIFYVGTRISAARHRYEGPHQIPVTDDGFVRELFAIPGVTGVVVDQNLVMLEKSTSAPWERIQGTARDVINSHLHLHQ